MENNLFDKNWKQEVQNEIDNLQEDLEPQFNERRQLNEEDRITEEEITNILRDKSNKSAGGEDGLNYQILKHCNRNLITYLVRLFTIMYVSG